MNIRKRIKWSRTGGYECSSKGDRRFSAFYAIMPDGNSIEFHYQCRIKGFPSIKEGKGKPPLTQMTRNELYVAYLDLWREWSHDHLDELYELRAVVIENYDCTLSDMFATSPVNQARALADLLNELP